MGVSVALPRFFPIWIQLFGESLIQDPAYFLDQDSQSVVSKYPRSGL